MPSSSSTTLLPLGLVFLSGIGFSIQGLFIKILSENGFSGSFQLLFLRGFGQLVISSIFVYRDILRGEKFRLFGNNLSSTALIVSSSLLAFCGQALFFSSIEYVPVDFALVLDRIGVIFQSILACLLLGEPWILMEIIATVVSILGVVCVSQPAFVADLFEKAAILLGVSVIDSASGAQDSQSGAESGASDHGFGLDENAMTLSDNEDLSEIGIVYGLLAAFLTSCAYVTVRMTGPSWSRKSRHYCGCCTKCLPIEDTSIPCPNVVFAASLSQLFLSIPCMLLSSKEEINLALSYSGWALLIGVAVIGTWSQLALTAGLQYEKAARTGVIRTSNVICGIIWQSISTGESPDGLTGTGVILVAIGSLLIVLEKNSKTLMYEACREYMCICCRCSYSFLRCGLIECGQWFKTSAVGVNDNTFTDMDITSSFNHDEDKSWTRSRLWSASSADSTLLPASDVEPDL